MVEASALRKSSSAKEDGKWVERDWSGVGGGTGARTGGGGEEKGAYSRRPGRTTTKRLVFGIFLVPLDRGLLEISQVYVEGVYDMEMDVI